MRTYLAIISLALFICAVSSRSISSFLNEDDRREVQRKINRDNLDEAILLARLRNLLDINDKNTDNERAQISSDESYDQDGAADESDDSQRYVRKKRQISFDDEVSSNSDDDVSSSDEDSEVQEVQNKQVNDVSNDSDEGSETQPVYQDDQNNDVASYNNEENERQSAFSSYPVDDNSYGQNNDDSSDSESDSQSTENID